jgi:hypothetical protein
VTALGGAEPVGVEALDRGASVELLVVVALAPPSSTDAASEQASETNSSGTRCVRRSMKASKGWVCARRAHGSTFPAVDVRSRVWEPRKCVAPGLTFPTWLPP